MNITRSHMRAHNLNEVKALIKEAYAEAAELDFQGTQWNKHDGSFLCTSHIRDTEFELTVAYTEELEGYRSVTVEIC